MGDAWAVEPPVPRWPGWLLRSTAARRIGAVLAGADAVALVVAAGVAATALVRGRATDGLALLVVPAVPLVAVGQLWLIGFARIRLGFPTTRRSWRAASTSSFFGDLDRRVGRVLLGIAALGWVAALTAFPYLFAGVPTSPAPGCLHRLEDHGTFTCVSATTYDRAGAATQRFPAGILMGFFALHLGGSLGGRVLQDRARDAA